MFSGYWPQTETQPWLRNGHRHSFSVISASVQSGDRRFWLWRLQGGSQSVYVREEAFKSEIRIASHEKHKTSGSSQKRRWNPCSKRLYGLTKTVNLSQGGIISLGPSVPSPVRDSGRLFQVSRPLPLWPREKYRIGATDSPPWPPLSSQPTLACSTQWRRCRRTRTRRNPPTSELTWCNKSLQKLLIPWSPLRPSLRSTQTWRAISPPAPPSFRFCCPPWGSEGAEATRQQWWACYFDQCRSEGSYIPLWFYELTVF